MDASELVKTVLLSAGGAAALVAGLAGWLGKVWSDRMLQAQKTLSDSLLQNQKLVGEIDLDLRKRRIEAYAPLWKASGLLPQWPRAVGVTYEQLQELSRSLRAWYYEAGGIYLSRSAHRDYYSPLQEALNELGRAKKSGVISDSDYDAVRKLCSRLRTAMANDIESRREGPIPERAALYRAR
jgi:hypothetical protein